MVQHAPTTRSIYNSYQYTNIFITFANKGILEQPKKCLTTRKKNRPLAATHSTFGATRLRKLTQCTLGQSVAFHTPKTLMFKLLRMTQKRLDQTVTCHDLGGDSPNMFSGTVTSFVKFIEFFLGFSVSLAPSLHPVSCVGCLGRSLSLKDANPKLHVCIYIEISHLHCFVLCISSLLIVFLVPVCLQLAHIEDSETHTHTSTRTPHAPTNRKKK